MPRPRSAKRRRTGQEEEVMNADQHRDIYIIFAAAIVFVLVATVFALWVAWR